MWTKIIKNNKSVERNYPESSRFWKSSQAASLPELRDIHQNIHTMRDISRLFEVLLFLFFIVPSNTTTTSVKDNNIRKRLYLQPSGSAGWTVYNFQCWNDQCAENCLRTEYTGRWLFFSFHDLVLSISQGRNGVKQPLLIYSHYSQSQTRHIWEWRGICKRVQTTEGHIW